MTPHLRRRGALTVLAVALLAGAVGTGAHDWPSPRASQPAAAQGPALADPGWSGLLWAGPSAGAPRAPQADDCHRPPTTTELPGRPSPSAQTGKLRPHRGRHLGLDLGHAPPALADRLMSESTATERASTPTAKAVTRPAIANAARAQPGAPLLAPPSRRPRPADEPVTAGMVDDNADFGAYLAYRERTGLPEVLGRPVPVLDVTERYRLTVHDATGRPVPDAVVQVFGAGRPQPLWARTDAGGQAWLHPRAAGLMDAVLEVQVHKPAPGGPLRGSALLQRGQRHQLQVRLDAQAPLERPRLDLVFLVDATGSMADEIDKLRNSMQAMARQIAQLPSHPQTCFALVAYRDQDDEFFVRVHDFTDDLGAFRQQLARLNAGGGGDTPEALNEALHTAVHRLSWRGDGATRLVVLVADAPPHLDYGPPGYAQDVQGALAQGIKLFAVGASGLDPSGEYIFRQMAQFTGGRFVFLTYADAGDPGSGPGRETVHDVGNYSVETLDKLVVRLVAEELAKRPT